MKYNLTKSLDGKIIEFICRGVEMREAILAINEAYEMEKCNPFQDMSYQYSIENGNRTFSCFRSNCEIKYQIERDLFQDFAIFKPRKYKNLPEFSLN